MRLLVTRPQPDAARTAERLRAAGHDVLLQPVLVTEFRPMPVGAAPAAIAVTSRNAVRALQSWTGGLFWHEAPVFAVGDATAAAARKAGFADVVSADGDGAALAGLIVRSRSPGDGAIFYPAAEDRSPVLEATLRAAGFAVDTIIAYRMRQAAMLNFEIAAALGAGRIDGVLLYSPRTARVFLELVDAAGLKPSLSTVTLYAISDATAAELAGLGSPRLKIAEHPDEDALLRLLS